VVVGGSSLGLPISISYKPDSKSISIFRQFGLHLFSTTSRNVLFFIFLLSTNYYKGFFIFQYIMIEVN
ncbi:hypothetical protein Taro_013483, partial [Colocasia esculenta]|nr:hypothetical protein [Colocasia esculenta]